MKYFTVRPVACYPEVLKERRYQMFSHASTFSTSMTTFADLPGQVLQILSGLKHLTRSMLLLHSASLMAGSKIKGASKKKCDL